MGKSLFSELKTKLQDVFKTNKNWWTKTSWKNLCGDEIMGSRIEKALQISDKFAQNQPYELSRKGKTNALKLREELELTSKRYDSILKGGHLEEFLERAITASCGEECCRIHNQYNLLSGILPNQSRKAIDLVIVNSNGCLSELIELKASTNTADNPLSAAFEIILDYLVLKHIKEDISKIEQLIILAPKQYYDYFGMPYNKYREVARILSRNLGLRLFFQTSDHHLKEAELARYFKPEEEMKRSQVVKDWFKARKNI